MSLARFANRHRLEWIGLNFNVTLFGVLYAFIAFWPEAFHVEAMVAMLVAAVVTWAEMRRVDALTYWEFEEKFVEFVVPA